MAGGTLTSRAVLRGAGGALLIVASIADKKDFGRHVSSRLSRRTVGGTGSPSRVVTLSVN